MSTRIMERIVEELASITQPLVTPFTPSAALLDSQTHASQIHARMYAGGGGGVAGGAVGERRGIEHQRERHGEVAVELALALADQLWCSTCRCSLGAGVQVRNHRRMGHVVELP